MARKSSRTTSASYRRRYLTWDSEENSTSEDHNHTIPNRSVLSSLGRRKRRLVTPSPTLVSNTAAESDASPSKRKELKKQLFADRTHSPRSNPASSKHLTTANRRQRKRTRSISRERPLLSSSKSYDDANDSNAKRKCNHFRTNTKATKQNRSKARLSKNKNDWCSGGTVATLDSLACDGLMTRRHLNSRSKNSLAHKRALPEQSRQRLIQKRSTPSEYISLLASPVSHASRPRRARSASEILDEFKKTKEEIQSKKKNDTRVKLHRSCKDNRKSSLEVDLLEAEIGVESDEDGDDSNDEDWHEEKKMNDGISSIKNVISEESISPTIEAPSTPMALPPPSPRLNITEGLLANKSPSRRDDNAKSRSKRDKRSFRTAARHPKEGDETIDQGRQPKRNHSKAIGVDDSRKDERNQNLSEINSSSKDASENELQTSEIRHDERRRRRRRPKGPSKCNTISMDVLAPTASPREPITSRNQSRRMQKKKRQFSMEEYSVYSRQSKEEMLWDYGVGPDEKSTNTERDETMRRQSSQKSNRFKKGSIDTRNCRKVCKKDSPMTGAPKFPSETPAPIRNEEPESERSGHNKHRRCDGPYRSVQENEMSPSSENQAISTSKKKVRFDSSTTTFSVKIKIRTNLDSSGSSCRSVGSVDHRRPMRLSPSINQSAVQAIASQVTQACLTHATTANQTNSVSHGDQNFDVDVDFHGRNEVDSHSSEDAPDNFQSSDDGEDVETSQSNGYQKPVQASHPQIIETRAENRNDSRREMDDGRSIMSELTSDWYRPSSDKNQGSIRGNVACAHRDYGTVERYDSRAPNILQNNTDLNESGEHYLANKPLGYAQSSTKQRKRNDQPEPNRTKETSSLSSLSDRKRRTGGIDSLAGSYHHSARRFPNRFMSKTGFKRGGYSPGFTFGQRRHKARSVSECGDSILVEQTSKAQPEKSNFGLERKQGLPPSDLTDTTASQNRLKQTNDSIPVNHNAPWTDGDDWTVDYSYLSEPEYRRHWGKPVGTSAIRTATSAIDKLPPPETNGPHSNGTHERATHSGTKRTSLSSISESIISQSKPLETSSVASATMKKQKTRRGRGKKRKRDPLHGLALPQMSSDACSVTSWKQNRKCLHALMEYDEADQDWI